ncbi:TraB/GumN family protein [Terricaulis sp.]|uniref:TraB/GumN family protein n=1 Tax=Terricaulis sp. TaxID=2768686 RepID=UPI003785190D
MHGLRRDFLAALAGLALAACAPAPAPAQQAAAEPALWRIHDGDSEIWLFGTAHVLGEDVRWQGPRLQAALAAADEIVTEMDTGPEATAEFQRVATELGTLPAGQTVFDGLTPQERARFERVVQRAGLQPAQFTQVRPWLATLQISYAALSRQGETREHGAETVLLAQGAGKRHSYFETPSEQVHILADLPLADQRRFMMATLRQIEEDTALTEALDAAWARGDVAAMDRQFNRDAHEAGPAVYEALIARRNRAWTERIVERLNGSGHIFIAVGAAHLVGDDGVVAQLRRRGIEVEGP